MAEIIYHLGSKIKIFLGFNMGASSIWIGLIRMYFRTKNQPRKIDQVHE